MFFRKETTKIDSSEIVPLEPESSFKRLEGILKKKNSKGQWKERQCILTDDTFTALKANKKGELCEIKERFNVKSLEYVRLDGEILEIKLTDGELMMFKGTSSQFQNGPNYDTSDSSSYWCNELKTRFEKVSQTSLTTNSQLQSSNGTNLLSQDDGSNFKRLEGILNKKNSKGQWKSRHCVLTDETFTALKADKFGELTEAKECFDVKLIELIDVKSGVLEIKMLHGDILYFQSNLSEHLSESDRNVQYSNDAGEWREALTARIDWALSKVSSSVTYADKVHISGWLLKKSHNKYNKQRQGRFVKVQGKHLYYYKKDGDDKEAGEVNLEAAEFIRPYDRSQECKIFEVFENGRLYSFQAESYAEMKRWVDIMTAVRDGTKTLAVAAERATALATTPIRIRIFDSEGVDAFQKHVVAELDTLYPRKKVIGEIPVDADPNEFEEVHESDWPLSEHLYCAKSINYYIDDFLNEIKTVTKGGKPDPRYDILAVFLVEVNVVLMNRLFPVLQPNSYQVTSSKLVDLHKTIDWISKFQLFLKRCHCPTSSLASVAQYLPEGFTPTYSPLFEAIPGICHRYVNGNGTGKEGDGAASHLVDHCLKVWERLINKPSEMMHQHMDGSFYTAAPTAIWEALHQHMQLATSTQCPVLHVLIADKIAAAIKHLVFVVEDYIQSVDLELAGGGEVKEIEIEFLSAIANDNALHIEEVLTAVESFELEEIRARIDELFNSVTLNLVRCGQTCLKRLSAVLYLDVEAYVKQVFTEEWIEGSQLETVTATLTDYMRDLQQYLLPFWTEKFIYLLLEYMTLRYTLAVIKAGDIEVSGSVSPQVSSSKGVSFLKGLGNILKATGSSMRKAKTLYCKADEESLGQLARDVNILNQFFHLRAGQESAAEFLGLINDVSLLLQADFEQIQIYIINRIATFPLSARAIYDMALQCLRMRSDISEQDIQELSRSLHPALAAAPDAAEKNKELGVAEGRLGLLYADLMALNASNKNSRNVDSATAGSLAQTLKDMANIPLAALKNALIDEDEEDVVESEEAQVASPPPISAEKAAFLLKRRQSVINNSTEGLVDDILDVLHQQDDELVAELDLQEQARQQEEARKKRGPGIVTLEGHLDKKSPAHNLWQSRWFKILTRENQTDDMDASPYIYQLLWYKKQGGVAVKALSSQVISQLSIQLCNRPLAWRKRLRKLQLMSEVENGSKDVVAVTICGGDQGGVTSTSSSTYVFYVFENGKEHILRASKIDKMITWINTLASIANLAYDESVGFWTRAAYSNNSVETENDEATQPVEVSKQPSYPSHTNSSFQPAPTTQSNNSPQINKDSTQSKSFLKLSDDAHSDHASQESKLQIPFDEDEEKSTTGRHRSDSFTSSTSTSSGSGRLVQKITGTGKYVTSNPIHAGDSNITRNPIMNAQLNRNSFDVESEVKEASIEEFTFTEPKTPRKSKQKSVAKVTSEDDSPREKIQISPGSRSLFRKKYNLEAETAVHSQSDANVPSASKNGLTLIHPSDISASRVHEAGMEWNKYYSDTPSIDSVSEASTPVPKTPLIPVIGMNRADSHLSGVSELSSNSTGLKHVSFNENPTCFISNAQDSPQTSIKDVKAVLSDDVQDTGPLSNDLIPQPTQELKQKDLPPVHRFEVESSSPPEGDDDKTQLISKPKSVCCCSLS